MLKQFRESQDMTQTQLAERAGVSINTIQRWEKEGFAPQALLDTIVAVSRALQIHVDTFCYFCQSENHHKWARISTGVNGGGVFTDERL